MFLKYISIFWEHNRLQLINKNLREFFCISVSTVSSPLHQKVKSKGLVLFLARGQVWKQVLLFSCTLEREMMPQIKRDTLKKVHELFLPQSLAKEENEEAVQKFRSVKVRSKHKVKSKWLWRRSCALLRPWLNMVSLFSDNDTPVPSPQKTRKSRPSN